MELEPLRYVEEDEELQAQITVQEIQLKNKCEPPSWLADAETPFKWLISIQERYTFALSKQRTLSYSDVTDDLNSKVIEFRKFNRMLAAIALKMSGIYQPSIDLLSINETDCHIGTIVTDDDDPETAYVKCKEALAVMAGRKGDIMYARIGPAMEHVLQATRAHMLYLQGNIAESQEIAKNIQPVLEMTSDNQAGIEGIKLHFLMVISIDNKTLLEISRRAMQLDPGFAEWTFLTGLILRRQRKEYEVKWNAEELKYFQKACDLDRYPLFIVFLAQAYEEIGYSWRKQKVQKDIHDINEMLRKSFELYRECWSLHNDSAAICRRIGEGLYKMDRDMTDLVLAKEALLKSLELKPSRMVYSCLGKFYYKHEKDDEHAIECLKKAPLDLYGPGRIIRLKLIRDYPNYDPKELIQVLEETASKLCGDDKIYCHIGFYYLFFKNELETAAKYFWKVLRKDYKSDRIMNFWSLTFCVRGQNMLRILVNEIITLKEKNESLVPDQKRDLTYLETFLGKILEKHSDLTEMRPNPKLWQSLCKHVEKNIIYYRKERYGYSDTSRVVGVRYQYSGQTDRNTDLGQTVRRDFREAASNKSEMDVCDRGVRKRGGRFNKCGSNNICGEEASNEAAGRRRANYSRYDVTVTDWRSENRNKGK